MYIKNKKLNLLNQSIENLSKMLQEGNYAEWVHLLGSKKEIIKRNLLVIYYLHKNRGDITSIFLVYEILFCLFSKSRNHL